MVSERLRINFLADIKFKLTISQNGKWTGKKMCEVLIVWRETINLWVHIIKSWR